LGCYWQSVGESDRIIFLKLEIVYLNQSDADAEAFFGGIALNRSIQALEIVDNVGFDDRHDRYGFIVSHTLFKAIVSLFQRALEHESDGVFLSCIKDVLTAAKSLKSVEICLHPDADWEEIVKPILKKGYLHHLSLAGGWLGREACAHMESLLSDEGCVLRSLILGNRYNTSPCVSSWDQIFSGLSNNKSVKCLGLNFGRAEGTLHTYEYY
jgi:hypothetical protein